MFAFLVATECHGRNEACRFQSTLEDERVSLLELRAVVDSVSPKLQGVLEDGLNPFKVLLEEDGGTIWVEASPHEGVLAEANDEEVERAVEGFDDV
ncbi:hypothetical protein RJT34_21705 [Clitoria ternatea]|uniref:Uncharacterized protein n=1 Tax=Clitoria ternatea TaxID=43366 RepID=A0AAN9IUJ4_CLITE